MEGQMKLKLDTDHLHELAEGIGAICLPSFLVGNELRELAEEAHSLPFHKLERVAPTGVIQNLSSCRDQLPAGGKLSAFVRDLGLTLNEQLYRISGVLGAPLVFNEAVVQMYPRTDPDEQYALSPHMDRKHGVGVIAVLVIEGVAPFCICRDREGTDPVVISSRPGELVLMRGYEYQGKPRPFHFVGPVRKGTRISLGMRQLNDRPMNYLL